jgi:tetratricopeptide (TPR) repeat protein
LESIPFGASSRFVSTDRPGAQEKYDQAAECGERALKITEKIFGPEHYHVSSILLRLGPLYYNQGKKEQGLELLKRCIRCLARAATALIVHSDPSCSIREKRNGPEHESVKEAKLILQELTQPKVVTKSVPPPPPPPVPKVDIKVLP